MQNILFIGLGVMGGPMARNLAASGRCRVTVFDIAGEKAEGPVAAGAVFADDLPAAMAGAEVVMTSLPGPAQVESVAFGDGGNSNDDNSDAALIANMQPGAVWLELSTNKVEAAERLSSAAKERGVDFLDCPVSGGDEGARAGTLTILAGGERAVFERCLPLLGIIGDNIRLMGPVGAGYTAKIAQVVLCYVHSLALSEAMMLGVKGGVGASEMLAVIRGSTGASYVADRYGPCIVGGDYDPSFTLGLAHKDMKLAMQTAGRLGIDLPLCELTEATYGRALAAYGFDANHLEAVRLLEEAGGTRLQDND